MKIIADLHTHTLASGHAYSTLIENCRQAKKKGLYAIAVTDHAPSLSDAPSERYFLNLRILPDRIKKVRVLKGVELNIKDQEGTVDLSLQRLYLMDFVIASFHREVVSSLTREECTRAYERVIQNPCVDILGHSGNPQFSCDYQRIVQLCAEYKKLIEVNESSFLVRPGSEKNCKEILLLCKKYHVGICVNSDAHFINRIGNVKRSLRMLKSIDFPKSLIINADIDRLKGYLKLSRQRREEAYARYGSHI